jgi:hypothetical protein
MVTRPPVHTPDDMSKFLLLHDMKYGVPTMLLIKLRANA